MDFHSILDKIAWAFSWMCLQLSIFWQNFSHCSHFSVSVVYLHKKIAYFSIFWYAFLSHIFVTLLSQPSSQPNTLKNTGVLFCRCLLFFIGFYFTYSYFELLCACMHVLWIPIDTEIYSSKISWLTLFLIQILQRFMLNGTVQNMLSL